eukprot:1194372-Prorocentrum_minimum.AAC.5
MAGSATAPAPVSYQSFKTLVDAFFMFCLMVPGYPVGCPFGGARGSGGSGEGGRAHRGAAGTRAGAQRSSGGEPSPSEAPSSPPVRSGHPLEPPRNKPHRWHCQDGAAKCCPVAEQSSTDLRTCTCSINHYAWKQYK